MKRKIAGFLAVILFVSIFQGFSIPVLAKEEGFKEMNQTLVKENGVYKLGKENSVKEDEVVIEIPMGKDNEFYTGIYTLTYFLASPSKDTTTKVDVAFDTRKIVAEADGDIDVTITAGTTTMNKTIRRKTITSKDANGWQVTHNTFGKIGFFIENDKMYFSGSGIAKGVLTPFTLDYKGDWGNKTFTSYIFKGIQDMEVIPTHLITEKEKNDLVELLNALNTKLGTNKYKISDFVDTTRKIPTLKRIPYIPATTEFDAFKHYQPGERPGILISFEVPKVIDKDGNISSAKEEVKGKIDLVSQYTEEENQLEYGVQFQLKDGAEISSTGSGAVLQKGEVIENGNKLEIYMSRDQLTEQGSVVTKPDVSKIHVLPTLKTGMVIECTLDLEGGGFDNSNLGVNSQYDKKSIKTGNTYLKYQIRRDTEGSITFEITPYPFKDTTTRYSIYNEEIIDPDNKPLQTNTYSGDELRDIIHMSIDKGSGIKSYYVGVEGPNTSAHYMSQIMDFDVDSAPISHYTEIINVEKSYVIPNDSNQASSKAEAVGINVTWQAPDKDKLLTLLDKGPIYYELYINDNNQIANYEKIAKIFKVTKVNGEVKIEAYEGETTGVTVSYYENEKVFRAEGIQLKKRKELISEMSEKYNWQSLFVPTKNKDGKEFKDYPVFGNEAHNIQEKNDLPYDIPNVFHFKMRSVQDLDNQLVYGSQSKSKSLAIDLTKDIIPAPENFKADDLSAAGKYKGEIRFNGVDLEPFIKYMFNPIGIELTDPKDQTLTDEEKRKNRRLYEVFVYQDQSIKTQDFKDAIGILQKEGQVLDFSKTIEGNAEKGSYIEALRKGKVIRIDAERYSNAKEEIKLAVEGLDPNTPYYVVARVKVEKYKKHDENYREVMYSIYTEHGTFTTDTNVQPPGVLDKVPTAPTNFWAIGPTDDSDDVSLHFTESEFEKYKEGEVYYELVRSEESGLGEYDSQSKSATDIAKSPKAPNVLLIDKSKTSIQWFNTSKNAFEDVKPTQTTTLGEEKLPESEKTVQAFTYKDHDLFPNTIYYYYVRTVHKIDGVELRSEFLKVPVTTDPVDKPIELKVESPKTHKYDTTDEVVISFWAPVPVSGTLGKDYDFEIDLMGENDRKYYTAGKFVDARAYAQHFISKEIVNEKYIKFVYKVSGLKHGTSYDLRVRIVDKTKQEEAYSPYSNKVRFRTDFDENEQDKEDKYKAYLEQYDKEVEKLKNNPYWVVEAGKNEGVLKYRKDYLGGILQQGNTYSLETLTFKEDMYYYFPKDIAEMMKKHQTMLEVVLEDYKVYVRANSFVNHEAIKEAEGYIEAKKSEDYYIAMKFEQTTSTGTVNGSQKITPELTVEMEIIYSDTKDYEVEQFIYENLIKRIEEGRKDFIQVLDKEMERDTFREDKVVDYIESEITWIQEKHQEDTKRLMRDIYDGRDSMRELKKPLLIVAQTKEANVEGYYRGSSWEKLYTYQALGGFGIETNKLGLFAFVRKGNGVSTVPTVPGAEHLIQKYYLSDYFTFDDKGLKSFVTKEQFYGTIARVIGGKRDANPIATLQNRGIKLVMPHNVYQTVRMDETLYVLMQAYEKMYYKPISSVVIPNNQQVRNIMAFQPVYRPYVQAAVTLGVVGTQNGRIDPSGPLTTESFIRMLVRIMPE